MYDPRLFYLALFINQNTTELILISIIYHFNVLVFPNIPPAPGMPCQGEDRKFFDSKV